MFSTPPPPPPSRSLSSQPSTQLGLGVKTLQGGSPYSRNQVPLGKGLKTSSLLQGPCPMCCGPLKRSLSLWALPAAFSELFG